MLHKDAVLGDAHFPHKWEYANAAARTGATGFTATDVNKLALQLDTNALYILTATTPTWVAVGVTGGVVFESRTAAAWTALNSILLEGQGGYETDTFKFKIGDGATAWNSLAYWRYVAKHATVATTGGATVLTREQYQSTSIQTTGVLVSNAEIIVANTMAPFVAENTNTGAFTTTFKTLAGTGVAVPQGTHQILYADGVNCEAASSTGAGSGDVVGPASAVNLNIATFSGTTGKLIADGGKALSELEAVANKATTFGTVNNTLYPTVQAVKTYADSLVLGLLDDRGNYDASGNVFPSTGGSGGGGGILKGDLWYISVAGTLGGTAVHIGDTVRALADTPGQTASNWDILLDARTAAADITVTSRTIGNSTNLDTALGNIDDSQVAQNDSGFHSWGGAGNYYSIATNQITLLRPGTGYVKGKKVTWTAPQTAAAFTPNSAHWIYIDSTGTIGITTNRTAALYTDNIALFEVHYDGTDYEVVAENHSVAFDMDAQEYLHETVGTVLIPSEGSGTIGADMTRVASGTGAVADDRRIKIVGAARVNDHGLTTVIPDSAGAAITWKFYYTNGSGNWTEISAGTEFPMQYNNAGTMTALATSGATDTGLWTCYVVKAEPNSGLPIYLAVAHTTALANDAAALAVVSAGTNAIATGTLFRALEPAQLGHVIVTNNVSGGYISTVNIAKSTLRSVQSGGGSTAASGISTNTVNFTGGLSSADSNVQNALETLDRLERLGTPIASASTVDLAAATGNYVHITGTTTITSFGTHIAGHLCQIVFDDALTITHNGTTLILPGAANIVTTAGSVMIVRSEGSGTTGSSGNIWRCVTYTSAAVTGTGALVRATSPTLVTPDIGTASATAIELGHASDTTLSRSAPGKLAIEGNVAATVSEVQAFTKSQSVTPVALTSAAASIAVDLSLSNNFTHTMTENTTLAAPTNAVAGTAGQIVFTQHASAAKTLAFNAAWVSVSGSAGVISTTLDAVNIMSYYVVDSTHIWYSWNTAAATAASAIANTPAGNISATNVQAAINEIDTEKAALAGSAAQAFSVSTLSAATTVGVGAATPSASGAGVTFPATQSASTNANTLDDYEEGTWTPVVASVGGTITTYTSEGFYTKTGNVVTCYLAFQVTNPGTASGTCNISSFPFTSINTSIRTRAATAIAREDVLTGAYYAFYLQDNATAGNLASTADGAINWTTNAGYCMSFSYLTA